MRLKQSFDIPDRTIHCLSSTTSVQKKVPVYEREWYLRRPASFALIDTNEFDTVKHGKEKIVS